MASRGIYSSLGYMTPNFRVHTWPARSMAQGASEMAYTPPPAADGSPRAVVPCVRLGVVVAAAFPKNGAAIDPTWAPCARHEPQKGLCFIIPE